MSALGSAFRDAARFWEPRRLPYNAILAVVVAGWIGLYWARLMPVLNAGSLAAFLVLALIANICYTAAYLVEVPLQTRASAAQSRRWRWPLWAVGAILAFVIANYWMAEEALPP